MFIRQQQKAENMLKLLFNEIDGTNFRIRLLNFLKSVVEEIVYEKLGYNLVWF